jgi:hypothetical protein
MTPRDFCYWLQGHFELQDDDKPLTKKQVGMIKEHLQLVFKKETTDLSVFRIPSTPGAYMNPRDWKKQADEVIEEGCVWQEGQLLNYEDLPPATC